MSEVQSPVPPPPVLKPTSSEETGIITHLRNVSGSKRFPLRVFKRLRPSPNVNSKAKERVNRKSPAEDPEVEDEYRLRDRIAARIQRLRHGSVDSQYEDDLGSEALVKFIDARQRPNDDVYDKDTYKWAILYENQRGATFFGSTRYSASSLLPGDPPPFTLALKPGVKDRRLMFTPHALKDFQLPDPTWMWVSRCWLVQMGGNGGSHDGFQYNWCFRQKGWRPYPGKFNSGGWVRRRRWIRLMMRPADPEFIPISTNKSLSNARPVSSWTGDVGKDIVHCRRILRQLGTDGRKIATWRRWLKVDERQSKAFGKTKRKASEEDDEVYPTVASPSGSSGYEDPEDDVPQEWEWAVAVIRCFTKDILFTFIYPESRARFIRMLQGLDLDSRELQHYLEIDFWVLAHLQL